MSPGTSEFATALQTAREARGLSVLDVARELRLSDRQIQGLEQDDLANFYSLVYAERAAIHYASFLGISTDLLGGPPYAEAVVPALVPSVVTVTATPQTRSRSLSPSASLYGAVGVLLAGVIIYLLVGRGEGEPPSPHAGANAVTTAPATPPPSQATPRTIVTSPSPDPVKVEPVKAEPVEVLPPPEAPQLAIQEPSAELPPSEVSRARRFWLVVARPTLINVVDAKGKKLVSGRQPISEGQRVVGDPPFQLETDDPDSIDVFYVGNRIRPLQSSTNRYTARFGAPD